jgi:hypothetical protein
VLLTAAALAGPSLGATQNDELTVDPTVPLSVLYGNSATADGDDADGGSILDIFGNTFTTYELSSVLIRAEDRIAVINEERVRVGDKVGSAVVRSIEVDHVTLSVDGEIETLELYENSIKTLVKGDE